MLGLGLRVGSKGKKKLVVPPTYSPVDANAVLLLHGDSMAIINGMADANTVLLLHGDSMPPSGSVDSNTKLLLHCDGVNGGTTFTDSSLSPKTVTANGGAITSAGAYVFGIASAALLGAPASANYLSVPDSSDWAFETGDFEIDLRVMFEAYQGSPYVNGIIAQTQDANNKWLMFYDSLNKFLNFLQVVGGTQNVLQQWHCDMSTVGQWYELTLTKASGVYTLRLNGAAQTQTVNAGASVAIADFSGPLTIGEVDNTAAEGMIGYLDELMISDIARHTSDFTPATQPYGGVSTFIDSSLSGKIVTVGGGANIDTTNKVFGAGSILFPTAPSEPSYLSVPDSADWAFGTGDFEIDMRIMFASYQGSPYVNGIISHNKIRITSGYFFMIVTTK